MSRKSVNKTAARKRTGAPLGFAAMDPEMQRRIASKGGQSVPPEKRSFSQDPALAAAAGRKGGVRSSELKRLSEADRGRKQASGARR